LAAFAVVAVLVPLVYTLITQHVWEDYLITVRHSRNLVEGKGLLYNPPDRVHGFTSPLGVLLPAACYALTGGEATGPSLWLFRVCCYLAFAGGGVLLLLALRRAAGGSSPALPALALLYLVEPKSVVYTSNGMETAFMLLFVSWALYLYTRNQADHWFALGLCWAGLMWTRPDSPIYIAAMSLAGVVFARDHRRRTALGLFKSAAVCTVLYLPWVAGAWIYYGNPVPHTVLAKSALERVSWDQLIPIVTGLPRRYCQIAAEMFLPIYYGMGPEEWPYGVLPFAAFLGLCAAVYWALPIKDRRGRPVNDWLGRYASFCYALGCLYYSFVPVVYPWYEPPVVLFGLVALTRGAFTLLQAGTAPAAEDDPAARRWTAPRIAFAILLAIFAERALLLGLTTLQMRIQVAEIEVGHRLKIAEFLREHVRSGERVYLEPFGYIGYYSGQRILDWPGLVSPEVVAARRRNRVRIAAAEDPYEEGLVAVAEDLKPEWMVVRLTESEWLTKRPFFQEYEWVKDFDAWSNNLENYAYIPGRGYLKYDSFYRVYHKKAQPGGA
jgi:hypothetical protein